ncbi:hypothetical protein RvY_06870-3 [Ramazzottius varieornatus]|uniref:Uncharacterized protein n=1 Tax=Ramazzottius varieornatus TaxID=947166 RepID=A0A1D1V3E1_RAMVA|nr:hypothetical protein RvY_06870-3 [Ramazzottius varieornatus]
MTLHSLCFKLWTFSFWFLLALTFVVLLVHQIDYRNSSGISKSPNIEIFSLPLDSFDYAEKVCPIQQLGQPTENTSVGSRTDAMLLESLRHKTVAFVGDSRIRHLCMRLLSALERIPFLLTSSNNHFHRDRRFYSKEFNTSLKFYWVVYPYEPRLKKILSRWARTTDPSPHIALFQFGAVSSTGYTFECALPLFSWKNCAPACSQLSCLNIIKFGSMLTALRLVSETS